MEQTPTTISPERTRTALRAFGKQPTDRTQTLIELEQRLIEKCNEIRATLPEEGWREAVEQMHHDGHPDLLDAYAMAADLGYLRTDVRWTIWGGRL